MVINVIQRQIYTLHSQVSVTQVLSLRFFEGFNLGEYTWSSWEGALLYYSCFRLFMFYRI